MSLTISVNTGISDAPLNSSGTEFIEFSSGNDQIIFTAGSTEVIDGGDSPTQQELISAGIILTGSEIIVSNYLMLDVSANLLKSIDLMGDLDSRYVLAFSWDAPTASEPVLEVWDDSNFNTITGTMLGGGTPSQSFIRGKTTTSASAGSPGWTGSRLAGSGSGNYLNLNDSNGALTVATVLYATLKIIIPSSQTTGFSATPVFVVKYLSN